MWVRRRLYWGELLAPFTEHGFDFISVIAKENQQNRGIAKTGHRIGRTAAIVKNNPMEKRGLRNRMGTGPSEMPDRENADV